MTGFQVGDRIADYELLKLAGEGASGRVYEAVQPRLERIVALKVIRPELASDEHFQERFRREMRLAASVDHPGVIPIYEVDEAEGVLFAAMRWVDGPDLGRLIADQGALDRAQAMHILRRLTAAVEAAHSVGLLHRGIKPANVLVEGDRVYLSDFGLALGTDNHDGDEQPARLVGTVEYAAPELLDSAPPDPRTDVYGLGCVTYEMLTGSAALAIEHLAATGPRGPTEVRPASHLRPDLPSAVDRVLGRALAMRPTDRYRTPAEFTAAVDKALGAPAEPDADRARARRNPLLLVLGSVALLVVAVIVAVVALHPGGDPKHVAGSRTGNATGGRRLPAAASLPACGHAFSGPPRDCRSPAGVNVITDLGKPLNLATMNLTATSVRVGASLHDSSGAVFTAPAGTRFLVIDATVTNITNTPQTFEPNNFTVPGRNVALWLFDPHGKIASYHGSHGRDYSTQYDTVLSTLRTPLYRAKLTPGLPYSGQLVFYYPDRTLDKDHQALLEVHELGRGFGYAKTLGGVRLHL